MTTRDDTDKIGQSGEAPIEPGAPAPEPAPAGRLWIGERVDGGPPDATIEAAREDARADERAAIVRYLRQAALDPSIPHGADEPHNLYNTIANQIEDGEHHDGQ